jgi:hypothetical protein
VNQLRWRYLAAFLLAAFVLGGQGHEFTHHLVTRLTCGAWGTMDLMAYEAAPGCEYPGHRASLLGLAAGPAVNYTLMIVGGVLAWRSRRFALLGVSLVFAALPIGRLLTLFGSGDEILLGQYLVARGPVGIWTARLFGLAIILPAFAAAWGAMATRWRWLVFAGLFLLPLLVLGGAAAWINPMLAGADIPRIIGLPRPLLIADLIAAAAFAWMSRHLVGEPGAGLVLPPSSG